MAAVLLALLVAAIVPLPGCAGERFQVSEELNSLYGELQVSALQFPRKGGEWELHYGDAPFYGTGFYVRAGATENRADYRAVATAAKENDLALLRRAQTDRPWFLANLEEVMMAGLGLIEYSAQTGDREFLPELESLIDIIDSVAIGLGKYIDLEAGMFAIKTYGPTAITAAVALLNLQYAMYFDTDRTAERLALAQDLIDTIEKKAWTGTMYRVRPDDDLLELYPNTMMMLVLTRLYEQTHDAALLARAEAVFEAIAPLKNKVRGGYNSPYSAKAMGAVTDDYSTLSSQNYLTLTLLVLFENTRKRKYLDEAVMVLDFIRTHLYDAQQGRVLHHFIDGRIALPSDPEYFCSGCNLQLLYVLWYLKERIERPQ